MIQAAELPRLAAAALARVRASRPRVHCLMNSVVQKFVADGVTAIGAIPSMTSSAEEVGNFVRKASALVVNLGTLDAARREAILIAVETANEAGRPWVLDPAHCDYSEPRRTFAQGLLAKGPAVMRANEAEFGLLDVPADVVGVETGRADRIGLGAHRLRIANGDPLMAMVTGTGCLSGGVLAAFLAIEPDRHLAAASAMLVVAVAAEIAAQGARGPGSFEPAFLDALAAICEKDIIQRARIADEQD